MWKWFGIRQYAPIETMALPLSQRYASSLLLLTRKILKLFSELQVYRRVMKRHLDLLKQNREVKGGKIRLSGRLNGAEISRSEWLAFGSMPLQTLRADIDYGEATAFNTYGTIGVKVWLYKGEIFDNTK